MENVNNYLCKDYVKELQEDFSAILPSGYEELGELCGARLGIEGILEDFMTELSGGRGRIGEFFLSLLGAAILLALIGKIKSPLSDPILRGSSAAIGAGMIAMLYPLISGVVESLSELGRFFSALAPILTAFLAFGGGEGSAAASSYLLSLTVFITGLVEGTLLLPAVGAVIGTSAISSCLGGPATAIATTVKNIFSRSVALVGALLGGVFALQTFVTASVDNASLRAMRYAVSGLVPIVGSTVSGAMSTIVGGLSGVGGIIGASSVAVILSISLVPLAYLFLYRLAFAVAIFVTDMLGGEATDTVKGLANSLDVLISVYVMTTIIYIFEIIVVILGGNMIFGGA